MADRRIAAGSWRRRQSIAAKLDTWFVRDLSDDFQLSAGALPRHGPRCRRRIADRADEG